MEYIHENNNILVKAKEASGRMGTGAVVGIGGKVVSDGMQ